MSSADVRIVSCYACPPSAPPDRLDVLFGLRKADEVTLAPSLNGNADVYRSELWRLHRLDGQWQLGADTFINLSASEILNVQDSNYDEVRKCMKVY